MFPVDSWIVFSLAAVIFGVGFLGVLLRRNLLVMLMCLELMLNAVNLLFIGFAKLHGDWTGQLAVFIVIVVAAAESAIGLGILIALFRTLRSVQTEEIELLRE